jgi:hypothetical protein
MAGEKKIRKTKTGKEVLKKLDMGESPEIEEKVMNKVSELLKDKGIDEKTAKESVAGAALRFVAKRPKGAATAAAGVAAGRASQRYSDNKKRNA